MNVSVLIRSHIIDDVSLKLQTKAEPSHAEPKPDPNPEPVPEAIQPNQAERAFTSSESILLP
jgi:hypothetical protein